MKRLLAIISVLSLLTGLGASIVFSFKAIAQSLPPGWSSPAQVDPIVGKPTSISCNSNDCFAVDSSGNVFTFAISGNSWSPPQILDTDQSLSSISCASSTLCATVDGAGNAFIYNGSSWTKYAIDPGESLVSVSCANTYCAALDQSGGAFIYSGTWSSRQSVETSNAFVSVSCGGSSLCAAIDAAGNAYIYNGTSWSAPTSGGGAGITSISCANQSTLSCVAVNGAGDAITLTSSGWGSASLIDSSGLLTSISCITSTYCYAVDQYGNFVFEENSGWSAPTQIASTTLSAISCVAVLGIICFTVAQNGASYVSGQMLGSSFGPWQSLKLEDSSNSLTSVSCPSNSMCFAGDSNGNILSWNSNSWSSPQSLFTSAISGLSCASTSFCMAVSTSGDYSIYNGSSWSTPSSFDSSGNVTSLSCSIDASVNSCLSGDAYGNLYGYTTSSSPPWQYLQTNSSEMTGTDCLYYSATYACYAVDSSGNYYYPNLSLPPPAYASKSIDSNPLSSISCLTSFVCEMGDSSGKIISDSSGGTPSSTQVSNNSIQAISCSGQSFCMALDSAGNAYLYNGSNWQLSQQFDLGSVPSSVSCPSATFCMAVDLSGQAFTWMPIAPGVFTGESPIRIVDTRNGATDPSTYAGQTLGGQKILSVPVVGANSDNVPSNATAVVINLTAVHPSSSGFLSVWPTGTNMPTVSSLNFSAGENAVANFVEVPIGENGEISIYNAFGSTDVLVDVEGWVSPATSNAGYYNPLSSPARIADTRSNSGYQGAGNTLTPTNSLTINVEGQGGVPSTGVSAVIINLTATNTTSNGGYLVAYPAGSSVPSASTVNFDANQSVPNRAIVALSSSGQMTISYGPVGSADVIVDVVGWFTSSSSSSVTGYLFHPVDPQRILDTRTSSGYPGAGNTLSPNTPLTVTVAGNGGIPAAGAQAVVANATVTNTTANGGYLTIYPAGTTAPPTSDLNWHQGETVANAVVATLGSNGDIDAVTQISSADLIIDVFGWYG
jgi:hypothetical protein